ncbi:hypothetical protein FOC4_g10005742 [Fusarium odoratissimum]|uniref:Uncharacterized protein n=1 Tax=Fusarium oxysporum f. sp. cubense (strain race 4) TaxID=2502994 RepID=N1RTY3_FUSC4|nr:hypothetical protein FOC4_g10005742 [Fusarium odoratissimum]
MTDFFHAVLGGPTIEEHTKALREEDLSIRWNTSPKEIEMDHDSQMERRIGSEPLIPTRGISPSQFIRPQKDQVSPNPTEPSRLQGLPDEILLMIVSYGCTDKYTSPTCPPGGRHCFDYKYFGEVQNKILGEALSIKGRWVARGFNQAKLPNGRICIANEGYIRICEHKTLTRADIQFLLPSEVPEDRPLFLTSCDHPDHKVPCNYNFDDTDQTPRVFVTNPGGFGVMLHILWQGHSGSDRSMLHQSGYLYRHKLNDSLRKIRQNGGQLFLPQRGPNTLPEWNAISEIDRSEVVSTEEDLIKLRGGWGYMNRQRRHNITILGPDRIACGHCRYDKSCIVVNYHRKIRFMDRGLSGVPHDWFHAIDKKSYVYNGPAGVPEACNNDICRNHYVGKQDPVNMWIENVNQACEIGDDRFGNRTCMLVAEEKQPYEDDRRTFESWNVHEIEESEEEPAPREQPTRTFESCEGYRTEESEEAPAPGEEPTRFNLHSLTTAILRAFDWQYWQTGRAQLSAD